MVRPNNHDDGVVFLEAEHSSVIAEFAAIASRQDPAHYSDGWGRTGDLEVAILVEARFVATAWVRLFEGSGDSPGATAVPELAIAVAPEFQGRGLGRKVLSALLARVGDEGLSAVELTVAADNPRARRLYESFEFVEIRKDESGRSWMRRPLR